MSRRTLQDYRNTEMIAYYQLGGKILYKESDMERMLAVNYDQYKIVSMPDGSIYDSQPFFRRILAKGKNLQSGFIVAFGQSGQTQDAFHYPLAVVGALLRIHVEDVPFVLRKMGGIAQHGVVGQCRCNQSRQVESLFTLGFAYGRAEVAQRADARIADHQYLLLPFVFFFHTEDGLLPQADSRVLADVLTFP